MATPSAQRSSKDHVALVHLRLSLAPSLFGLEPSKLFEVALDREGFEAIVGLLPTRSSPGEIRA